jgi:CspA family cold shock protein
MANFENNGSQPLAKASVKGTVKWFNSTKGYGFITLEDGSDAFCHASALASQGTPNVPQGATVVCDLQDSLRGLQVVAVHSIDTSTADPAPSQRPRSGGDRFGGNQGDRHGGGDRFGGGDRYGGGDRFGGDDRFSDRFGGGDRFSSNADRFGGDRFGGDKPREGARDAGPSGPMVDGRVKFFNDQKGFGFVMPDNGGGDVYCHASALRRSGLAALSPEQRIRFSTRQGTKGVEVDRIELI